MSKENKMTVCSHCGAEIASSAKVCPKCGGKNKKPIYKRTWFIILAVIIVLGIISSAFGGGNKETESSGLSNNGSVSAVLSQKTEEQTSEQEITYTPYTVSQLMSDLDTNALGASEKYKGQYVELTGKLNAIDSDGKYIDIVSGDDEFEFIGVTCYIKSDEQKAVIMSASTGDTLVVKGKITDVGDVLGYYLNIDEIAKQ